MAARFGPCSKATWAENHWLLCTSVKLWWAWMKHRSWKSWLHLSHQLLEVKKKKKRFPVTQNSQRCSTSVEYMNGFLLLNTCFCCFKGLNILFQRRNKVKHSSSCTIICLFFCLSGILNVLAQEMLSFLQFYSLFPFEMLFVHCNTENIWNVACLYIQIKYQIYQWGKYYLTVPVFPFFLPSL